jgi:hypothetical protein
VEERQFSRFISHPSARGFPPPFGQSEMSEVPDVSSALVALSQFWFTESGIVRPDRQYSPQTKQEENPEISYQAVGLVQLQKSANVVTPCHILLQ